MRLDRRLWAPALSLVLLLSLSPPAAEAMDIDEAGRITGLF